MCCAVQLRLHTGSAACKPTMDTSAKCGFPLFNPAGGVPLRHYDETGMKFFVVDYKFDSQTGVCTYTQESLASRVEDEPLSVMELSDKSASSVSLRPRL